MNIENNGRLEDKLVEVRLYSSECQNAVNGPIILYHLVGGGGRTHGLQGGGGGRISRHYQSIDGAL